MSYPLPDMDDEQEFPEGEAGGEARGPDPMLEGLTEPHQLELTLDGERLQLFTVTPDRNVVGQYYADAGVEYLILGVLDYLPEQLDLWAKHVLPAFAEQA